jgi:hypothetical protein
MRDQESSMKVLRELEKLEPWIQRLMNKTGDPCENPGTKTHTRNKIQGSKSKTALGKRRTSTTA